MQATTINIVTHSAFSITLRSILYRVNNHCSGLKFFKKYQKRRIPGKRVSNRPSGRRLPKGQKQNSSCTVCVRSEFGLVVGCEYYCLLDIRKSFIKYFRNGIHHLKSGFGVHGLSGINELVFHVFG